MTNPKRPYTERIRSFVRRQGRLTLGQQLACDSYWQDYVLDPTADYDLHSVFGRRAELILEIGFGNGDSLLQMAIANPERNYIGIEVHRPGIGHLMLQLREQGVSNVRLYHHDAIDILEHKIPDHSLSGIQLFFPDPWHKTRHHKRRIVRPEFVSLLARKLKANGYFHAATDWQNYAKHMLSVLNAEPLMTNTSPTADYCARPDYRPLTKFENRGLRLGHGVWDLVFRRSEVGIHF